ncbi:hypothetical protein DCS_05480 [Drechmeria coniospora]|uniref:DUF7514 domain-containing protein n=1 Tax=Drechmeria coniospora TaxID=98403 RepID=A0A151GMW4_DRECN|nr:hypothetical protein DCS_05480 [Drechmeria coniospora]KYK58464.1 hypothetical protein DCS_05480 [Drechmeria coniospora]
MEKQGPATDGDTRHRNRCTRARALASRPRPGSAQDIYTLLVGLGLGRSQDLKRFSNALEQHLEQVITAKMSHNNSNSITNTNTSSNIQNDTSNMNITSQDHTTFSGMPSKEQVEGVVRAVFKERIVNNMNHDYDPEWVEEIVDFLQKRINLKNETSDSSASTSPTSTCTSSAASTPQSEYESSDFISAKPYQATVEDDTSSLNEEPVLPILDEKPAPNSSRRRPPHLSGSNDRSATPAPAVDASPNKNRKPLLLSRPESVEAPPAVSRAPSPRPRPTVHFSDRPLPKLHQQVSNRTKTMIRPDSAQLMSLDDLQWGRVFDVNAEPTVRLRNVLLGLAKYINDEFEPRGSPVITPDKMYTFYRKFRVDKELYPFQRIFDTYSRKSLYALRRLFKDLQCEYFAVNSGSRDADRPSVAALSPKGFVDWMVTFMQATPDIEARRLSRVVATLPIAAADANTLDGRLQRLPKQLSRHLFPSRPQDKTRQWVSNAVMDWDQTMSQVEWLSVSWTTAFCDALCRSLSPAFRGDSGRGDSRRKRCTRTERASYVEVPSSKPQNRSPRQQKSDGRGERPMRDVIRTYVEGSSPPRHLRDASPSRQHYVRDRRYRRSEPKANRQRHAAASPAHESSCASSLHSRNTAQVTSPPSRTAEPLNRVDNYALFQGRSEMGPGPTYEEFLRETGAWSSRRIG